MTYGKAWLEKHGHPAGRVFEIINKLTGDNYIGHTTMPIKKRMYQVITAANTGKKGLLYDAVRQYGKEQFVINILHECSFEEDVVTKEREFVVKLSPSLNKESFSNRKVFEIVNVVTGDNYIDSTSRSLDKKLLQLFIAAKAGREGMIYDDIRSWGEECYEIKHLKECRDVSLLKKYIYELNPSLNENKDEWLFL